MTDGTHDIASARRWLSRQNNPGSTWSHDRVAAELQVAVDHIKALLKLQDQQAPEQVVCRDD